MGKRDGDREGKWNHTWSSSFPDLKKKNNSDA